MMRLKILEPTGIVVDEAAAKVTAVAENGSFCLLPGHVSFLAALVPGLLSYEPEGRIEQERGDEAEDTAEPQSAEVFLAVDEGMLVKRGSEVLVSTRRAVRGGDLGQLQRIVHEQFEMLDERQRSCRSAISKLESDMLRRMMELGD